MREKFPEVDPRDFESPNDPIIIKQLMQNVKDQEMEEGESEGEFEEEADERNPEWNLDPNITSLKIPGIQSSSRSSSSSSDKEEEGHKDMESEPSNAA